MEMALSTAPAPTDIFATDFYKQVCYQVGMQHNNEVDWLWQKLSEQRPQTVLEIGTGGAGSTVIFALSGATVVTVDEIVHPYERYYWSAAVYRAVCPSPKIYPIQGSSHRLFTYLQVEALGQAYDWVVIDGDHSAEGGWQDWEMYAPLAKQAVLIHDIVGYQHEDGGDWFPREAWREFKLRFRTAEMVDVVSGGWGLVYTDGQILR